MFHDAPEGFGSSDGMSMSFGSQMAQDFRLIGDESPMTGYGTDQFYPHNVIDSTIPGFANPLPYVTMGVVGYGHHAYYSYEPLGVNSDVPILQGVYDNPPPYTTVNPQFCRADTMENDSPSRGDGKNRSTVKPTSLLRRNSTASTQNSRYDLDFHGGPQEMRDMLAESPELDRVDDSLRNKFFSKQPKTNVTSPKSRQASNSRRKHEARFICPFEDCSDDFTRKHNLDNHLKAHCGITDFICYICKKPFTTLPVLNRHVNTCKDKYKEEDGATFPEPLT